MAEIVPPEIAKWVPFTDKGETPLRHDIVCVHTMVGTLAGSWSWANGDGRAYWHFGMAGWGETWQCQDLRYRSASNLEGNPYVIPIETADMGAPFDPWSGRCGDVPAWTDAQVDSLIELIAWLCVRYDIPPGIIPDTQAGRRGLAYHRQGVPESPEWESGNLRWSSSVGKCCPDWRRIEQFKTQIVPEVAHRVLGRPEPEPEPIGDKMLYLVKTATSPGPGNGAWLTDWLTKRLVPNEDIAVMHWINAKEGGQPISTDNGRAHLLGPDQADVLNRIPVID